MVKFNKELQFPNAVSPMYVTEFGMVKFTKALQPSKAQRPMWVTEPGMVKLVKKRTATLAGKTFDVGQ